MKFASFLLNNTVCFGTVNDDGTVTDLSEFGIHNIYDLLKKNIDYKSFSRKSDIKIGDVKLLAPVPEPRQDIICLGINYAEHAQESARYKKETYERSRSFPVYFSKRVNEALPDGGTLNVNWELDSQIDYEAELAVIIGKDAKNVAPEDVRNYIFGYTVINDISARTLQSDYKQWYFGKSLDGFTPMGPWIVTADEFEFEPKLKIESFVNGELRQCSSTDKLIFGIKHIVSELSRGITLKAGTIISTGTPAGAGMGFVPPKFLKSGDTVECRIEKIGTLTTYIK